MPRRKREAKEDLDGEGGNSSPSTKKSKQPDSKFGGMTEEEVAKLLLPDHMKPGLDIIFVSARILFENSLFQLLTHILVWKPDCHNWGHV